MAACPHCSAVNEDGVAFCAQCGKALPELNPSLPRIVAGNQVAATAVGQDLQADQLHRKAKQAFGALLAVAILTFIFGLLLSFALGRAGKEYAAMAVVLLVTNLILAGIYAGLAFWARKNPLPAALVGLVLFVTIHVINVVMDPMTIAQGIIVKIIIIAVLVRAIQAGTKHKKLREQMALRGA